MKFSKILHPEVVLGLRGSKLTAALYRVQHEHVAWTAENGFVSPVLRPEHWTASQEEDIFITWKYKQERPPIYHVPKPFLHAIAKIDKEIPVNLLPERFFAYFSFAENTVWDGSEWAQGIYVFIGPENETPLRKELRVGNRKVLWAVYYTAPPAGATREHIACARLLADLDARKFTDIVAALPLDKGDPKDIPNPNVFLIGLNLAMYVNSVGCDLLEAPPVHRMKPAEKKDRQKRGELINQCLLPVTLVSWNYKQERVYSVDSTWIDTFPRWQRCGPENSQVKLIWVNPFPRKYKNVRENDEK